MRINPHEADERVRLRFLDRVARSAFGCWRWCGTIDRKGYGVFSFGGRAQQSFFRAHRLAFAWEYGVLPDDMVVMHACDNPLCVRPDHLRLGTQLDNVRDMDAKNRRRSMPRRKLSDEQVAEIRALRGKHTLRVLAERFKVSRHQIWMIHAGRCWPCRS